MLSHKCLEILCTVSDENTPVKKVKIKKNWQESIGNKIDKLLERKRRCHKFNCS